jgi:hypothetical protein
MLSVCLSHYFQGAIAVSHIPSLLQMLLVPLGALHNITESKLGAWQISIACTCFGPNIILFLAFRDMEDSDSLEFET